MNEPVYLYFEGLNHPLCFIDCEHLTESFSILFPEWDYSVGEHRDTPIISIKFESNEYRLSRSWSNEIKTYTDKIDILCELVAQILLAKSFSDSEALYLHAASVVINGRAIVFPSQFRAGKSLLTACLTAAGCKYFCDDVFPLTIGECKGKPLSVAPRLRLPLPDTIDLECKNSIESHMKLRGKRYAYLELEKELRVTKDILFDVGAFVLLERREGRDAEIEELPAAVIFQQLIKQNFAREIDASLILLTLSQAISQAQCLKIYYDRAGDAVILLNEYFSSWPSESTNAESKSYALELQNRESELTDKDCLVQNKGVQKIKIDGESFLTSSDGQAIYHLDMVGSGIWELLSEQISKDEIIEILATAFPETDKATIEKDTLKVLSTLKINNLIT